MADGSKIEWTDATWNPITGCSVVSPGCTNCYAMKLAGTRLKNHPSREGLTRDTKAGPVWTGEVRFNPQWLDEPLHWKKPRMIFVCAHGDLFAEGVPDEWIDQVFAIMSQAPQHTFQVLTKRPERMRSYLTRSQLEHHLVVALLRTTFPVPEPGRWPHLPLPNVWLGVSVEDQKRADERQGLMLEVANSGWHTWVSYEPAIGPVDWKDWRFLRWLVSGGESGPRPTHPDWHRATRDFCASIGIPYLFKQWGTFAPRRITISEFWNPATAQLGELIANSNGKLEQYPADTGNVVAMRKLGKKEAGRLLDGIEHNGFPETRR
ncbi:phage Gp37/Gp68 family protein [Ensifer sp. 22460]|uniref:phage Gp37/Gp68 family protein n=1 Tax=Ensifer sp. 22460 TaxID=3453922 RepID=UPI003F829D2E